MKHTRAWTLGIWRAAARRLREAGHEIADDEYVAHREAGDRWCSFGGHFVPERQHNGSSDCRKCASLRTQRDLERRTRAVGP